MLSGHNRHRRVRQWDTQDAGRAQQSRVRQGTPHSVHWQDRAGQGRAGQGQAGQDMAGQGSTWQGRAGESDLIQ